MISKLPSSPPRPTPLLFVHGAWHGAWCWAEHILDYFAAAGYGAHAVSLRGHGGSAGRERLRWTRIADYVADVAEAGSRLPSPPIVIGHSMGGLVVQKYLERYVAPAAVLLASVPPTGALMATLRTARRHPLEFVKTNLTLSLYPIIGSAALTRDAFFSADVSEADVGTYFARMQDESYRAFLDMIVFSLPRPRLLKTPMLVLGGARDAIFSPAEVEATARAYNTEAVIFPNTAHDMMLEPTWPAVAERMASWFRQRGL